MEMRPESEDIELVFATRLSGEFAAAIAVNVTAISGLRSKQTWDETQ
jgi:hypothetical protein